MVFELKKANFEAIKRLRMTDRLQMASDSMGTWLLSLMTPTQLAELFPRYYRDNLPNINGLMRAMPTSMTAAKQQAIEEQLNNTASGSAAGSNYESGGWRKKWQEGVSRGTASRKGVTPPPQLSPEQQAIWNDVQKNPLSVDDPRAKMFAGLTAEQMASVGLSKYKDANGKEFYKYAAPSVTGARKQEVQPKKIVAPK